MTEVQTLSAGFVDGSTGPPIDPGEDVMLYSQRANQIRLEDAVKRLLADSAKRRRKRSNTEGISGVTPHSDGKKIIPRVPLGRWRRESAVTQRVSIDRDLWRQQVKARLRRCLRVLRTVLRCFRLIIHLSQQRTSWTATELQWFTLHNSQDARTLAFNPAKFASSSGQTKIPEWAKRLMAKDPQARTEVECRKLHALLRGMRSFDRFTERIQLAMCRAFTYCRVSCQRVLLRRGHVGQFYYIVYSGSVFVNVQDTRADGQVFHKTQAILTKGDAFGELALLTSCRRNATITCREECELLAVDKDVFAVVCPRIFDHELDMKTQFLGQLPLFHTKYWTNTQLRLLSAEAQIQEYKTNKVVVSNSHDDEWVYICMEGECRVIKYLLLTDGPAIVVEEDTPYDSDLTAEFLDSMKEAMRAQEDLGQWLQHQKEDLLSDSGVSDEEVETMRATRRRGMLDSMKLQYDDRMSTEITRRRSTKYLLHGDITPRTSRPSLLSRRGTSAESGQQVLSFNALVELRRQYTHPQDAVYLNIGSLRSRQIFDLVEVLHPVQQPSGGNCVMLVSGGAKLLRLPRATLRKQMTPEAQQHADHLCVSARYPADSTLLASYRQRTAWDAFKRKTMQQVLKSMRKTTKRPLIVDQYSEKFDRKQRTRLMRTLRRGSIEPEPEMPSSEGLDTPEVDHEDSESRYMKQLEVPSVQRLLPGARGIQEYRARTALPKPIY